LLYLRSQRGATKVTVKSGAPEPPKDQWTMPPLALLERPRASIGRRVTMLTLEGYLLVAIALLIVKAVQLAGG
ncbi:MAG: hypothetical protein JOZ64_12305, partial [Solirubrobacterales bacterium]|nr:hypothetical protein [Solirubrobacterales bacterium]